MTMKKTTITLEIYHTKDIQELVSKTENRVYTIDGVSNTTGVLVKTETVSKEDEKKNS